MVAVVRPALAEVAERAIHATLAGSVDELAAVVRPDAVNRESVAEPPATRGVGPAAFHATGAWLRTAFTDLRWTTRHELVDGDLVATYGTLAGRQTGPFSIWTPQGTLERVFVPTGASFVVRQAHFQRVVDGLVVEHWAVRDDQGMATQLGWVRPSLGFLVRCEIATRRARRAENS